MRTSETDARRILGVRKGKGLIDPDPRTLMGVLVAVSVTAFMGKSIESELLLVLMVSVLQALCGHVRMAVGFAVLYAALWAVLNVVLPGVGGVAATMFTISLTFARKIYLCLMVGTLLVRDNTVHRIASALAKLRVPQAVLIPLTVTMRYFPTLREEAAHIRGRHGAPRHPGGKSPRMLRGAPRHVSDLHGRGALSCRDVPGD